MKKSDNLIKNIANTIISTLDFLLQKKLSSKLVYEQHLCFLNMFISIIDVAVSIVNNTNDTNELNENTCDNLVASLEKTKEFFKTIDKCEYKSDLSMLCEQIERLLSIFILKVQSGDKYDEFVDIFFNIKSKTKLLEKNLCEQSSNQSDNNLDQKITPWEVIATKGINYDNYIKQFGCETIDGNIIRRFEQVTGVKVHTWLRRGLFFSGKDISEMLDDYQNGKQIYIYTGRGPSGEMHLGHLIPFMFTKWLQDALQCIVIIQLSDDEKFYFKGNTNENSIEYYNNLCYENAKDIIACGFNIDKTFIFSNYEGFDNHMYKNVVKINKLIPTHQIEKIFGFSSNNSIGQMSWPVFQIAPTISTSFPYIFHRDTTSDQLINYARCVVIMAVDQYPFFALARTMSEKCKNNRFIKPTTLHSKFIPSLNGTGKMSSTNGSVNSSTDGSIDGSTNNLSNSLLKLTDDYNTIKKKINKHTFSGGKENSEIQKKYGANLHTDVCYHLLTYFLENDNELSELANNYRSGKILTGEIKNITANKIWEIIKKHQANKLSVSDNILQKFFCKERDFDLNKIIREPISLESDEIYQSYGYKFDLHFGAKPTTEAFEYEIEQARKCQKTK